MSEFIPFTKIPRLSRECVITEKIDGTNASICILEDWTPEAPIIIARDGLGILAGSRTRWITVKDDNFGFAKWVEANSDELFKLGPGHHFGEWWGKGIQRGYNQIEKKFSLFNVAKWSDDAVRPACCGVVPVLFTGEFRVENAEKELRLLELNGSRAALGYPYPEGVVVYHRASGHLYKKTIEKDEQPKGKTA